MKIVYDKDGYTFIITSTKHYKYGHDEERIVTTELCVDKEDGEISIFVEDTSATNSNNKANWHIPFDITDIPILTKMFIKANGKIKDVIQQFLDEGKSEKINERR